MASSFSFQIINEFPEVVYIPFKLLQGQGVAYTYTDPNKPDGVYIPMGDILNIVVNSDGSLNIRGYNFSVESVESQPIPFASGSVIPVVTPLGLGSIGIPDWNVTLTSGGSVTLGIDNFLCQDWDTKIYPDIETKLWGATDQESLSSLMRYAEVSLAASQSSGGIEITGSLTYAPLSTLDTSGNLSVTLPMHADLYVIARAGTAPAFVAFSASTQDLLGTKPPSPTFNPGAVLLAVDQVSNEVVAAFGIGLNLASGRNGQVVLRTYTATTESQQLFDPRLSINDLVTTGTAPGFLAPSSTLPTISPLNQNTATNGNNRLLAYEYADYEGTVWPASPNTSGVFAFSSEDASAASAAKSYRLIVDYAGGAQGFAKVDKKVEVFNQLPLPVYVYTVNNDGTEVLLNSLAAGQRYIESLYIGQLIVVRLAKLGKVVQEFYTRPDTPSVVLSYESLWTTPAPGAKTVASLDVTFTGATSTYLGIFSGNLGPFAKAPIVACPNTTSNGSGSFTVTNVAEGTLLCLCADSGYKMPIAYAWVNGDGTVETILTYRNSARANNVLYEGEVAIYSEADYQGTCLVLSSHLNVSEMDNQSTDGFSQYSWNSNMVDIPASIGSIQIGPNTEFYVGADTTFNVTANNDDIYTSSQSPFTPGGIGNGNIVIARVDTPTNAKVRIYNSLSEDYTDPSPGKAAATGKAPLTKGSYYRTTLVVDSGVLLATKAKGDFEFTISTDAAGGASFLVNDKDSESVAQSDTITLQPNAGGRLVLVQNAVRNNSTQESAEFNALTPAPNGSNSSFLGSKDPADTTVTIADVSTDYTASLKQLVVSDNSAFNSKGGTAQFILSDGTKQPFAYAGTSTGNVLTGVASCPSTATSAYLHVDKGQLWAPTILVRHNGIDPITQEPLMPDDAWITVYPDSDVHTKMTSKLGTATSPTTDALKNATKTEVTYGTSGGKLKATKSSPINIVPDTIRTLSTGSNDLCADAQKALMSTVATVKSGSHESASGVQSHVHYEGDAMPDSAWMFGQQHFLSGETPTGFSSAGTYYQSLDSANLTALTSYYKNNCTEFWWDGTSAGCWHSFTHAVSHAFNVVVQGVEDAAEWVAHAAETVWDDVKKAVVVSIHWIENEAKKVAHFVVDTVEKIAAVCKAIFTAIKTAIEDIIKFLEYFFEFDDMWHTAEVFKDTFNNFMSPKPTAGGLVQMMNTAKGGVTNFFDQAKKNVDSDIQSIFHNSPNAPGAATLPTGNPMLEALEWILNKVFSWLDSSSDDPAVTITKDITKLTTDISTNFGAAFGELSPATLGATAVEAMAKGISGGWEAALAPIGTWLENIINDVITGVEDLVLDLITLAEACLEAIVDMLQQSVFEGSSFLGKLIQMVLSWAGGSNALTWENLMALVLGVPYTIGYKLANDGKAPYGSSPSALSLPEVTAVSVPAVGQSFVGNSGEIEMVSLLLPIKEVLQAAMTFSMLEEYSNAATTGPSKLGIGLTAATSFGNMALFAWHVQNPDYASGDFSSDGATKAPICNVVSQIALISESLVSTFNLLCMSAAKSDPAFSTEWRGVNLGCQATYGALGTAAGIYLLKEAPDYNWEYYTANLCNNVASMSLMAALAIKAGVIAPAVVATGITGIRAVSAGFYLASFWVAQKNVDDGKN